MLRDFLPLSVVECIGSSAISTSCATSDTQCLCSTQSFLDDVMACLQDNCSAEDQQAGLQFGMQVSLDSLVALMEFAKS